MSKKNAFAATLCALLLVPAAPVARADLTLIDFVTISGGLKPGLAYAPLTDTLWSYTPNGIFIVQSDLLGGTIDSFSIPALTNSSASALDVTTVEFDLNGTTVPIGSILYFEGSREALDIYAYSTSGTLIAALATQFGMANTTGGALHPQRGTLFVVHAEGNNFPEWFNQVAEIDPSDGSILASYDTNEILFGYDVQQGGLDIDASGNIHIVSDSDMRILVIEPDGTFVETIDVPPLMSPRTDLTLDDPSGDVLIASFNRVYRLRDIPNDSDGDGVPDDQDNCIDAANPLQDDADGDDYGNICDGDFNNDCIVASIDLGLLRFNFFGDDPVVDINSDGIINAQDLGIFRSLFFQAPGPSGLTTACQ